jgi:hypothetical protein
MWPAHTGQRMASLFQNLFGGYRQVRSPLQADRVVRSPTGFAFGVPWPWKELPFSALEGVAEEPDLAVAAPRTDGRSPLFMVTMRGAWNGLEMTDTTAMLHTLASQHGGRPIGIRRVLLGGAHAQVLGAATAEGEVHQLLTSRGQNSVEGFLRIPTPAYMHHFDVMLATWQWI